MFPSGDQGTTPQSLPLFEEAISKNGTVRPVGPVAIEKVLLPFSKDGLPNKRQTDSWRLVVPEGSALQLAKVKGVDYDNLGAKNEQ